MRVVHVVPPAEPPWTGVLAVIVRLSCALAAQGHDVTVWRFDRWEAAIYSEMRQQMQDAGVASLRLPSTARRALRRAVTAASVDADVVVLHSVFLPSNVLIARSVAVPYVLTPHGGYAPRSMARSRLRKRIWMAVLERRMLHHASTVAALTDHEAADILRVAPDSYVDVIPNGVDPAPEVPPAQVAELRPRTGLLALSAGRLDVLHKGLDHLVRALADAPEWRLVFVGPDHRGGRHELERLAHDLGVGDRIDIVDVVPRTELQAWYEVADLFVLASRWEGMPLALLEALAHGTPALVSPVVDRLVPVARAGAGWVASPSDLAPTLRHAAALLPRDRGRLQQAARGLAARYSWDAVATLAADAYRRAVESSRTP